MMTNRAWKNKHKTVAAEHRQTNRITANRGELPWRQDNDIYN